MSSGKAPETEPRVQVLLHTDTVYRFTGIADFQYLSALSAPAAVSAVSAVPAPADSAREEAAEGVGGDVEMTEAADTQVRDVSVSFWPSIRPSHPSTPPASRSGSSASGNRKYLSLSLSLWNHDVISFCGLSPPSACAVYLHVSCS